LNAKILDFGKTLQQLTGCELEINDTFKTEYSFNCSSNLFQEDYDFSFNDTIESMYLEISRNSNNILVNEKREKRDTI